MREGQSPVGEAIAASAEACVGVCSNSFIESSLHLRELIGTRHSGRRAAGATMGCRVGA